MMVAACLVALWVGYSVCGYRVRAKLGPIHAQMLAEQAEYRAFAAQAYKTHDAAMRAWHKAIEDRWYAGCEVGAGDEYQASADELDAKSKASMRAAEQLHTEAREAWSKLKPVWGE